MFEGSIWEVDVLVKGSLASLEGGPGAGPPGIGTPRGDVVDGSLLHTCSTRVNAVACTYTGSMRHVGPIHLVKLLDELVTAHANNWRKSHFDELFPTTGHSFCHKCIQW